MAEKRVFEREKLLDLVRVVVSRDPSVNRESWEQVRRSADANKLAAQAGVSRFPSVATINNVFGSMGRAKLDAKVLDPKQFNNRSRMPWYTARELRAFLREVRESGCVTAPCTNSTWSRLRRTSRVEAISKSFDFPMPPSLPLLRARLGATTVDQLLGFKPEVWTKREIQLLGERLFSPTWRVRPTSVNWDDLRVDPEVVALATDLGVGYIPKESQLEDVFGSWTKFRLACGGGRIPRKRKNAKTRVTRLLASVLSQCSGASEELHVVVWDELRFQPQMRALAREQGFDKCPCARTIIRRFGGKWSVAIAAAQKLVAFPARIKVHIGLSLTREAQP
jgi:hypothetical protein